MDLIEILAVIGIDILLSGDNAVIIALSVRKLPIHLQNKVIFWGMLGAIVLRIIAATLIVNILEYSFIQAIGGIILCGIAFQMMVQKEETQNIQTSNHFWGAIKVIAISDLTLSIDNVIALASVSKGITAIILGIFISIPIIIFGSKFLLRLMERFPIIIYVGSGLLVFAACKMILEDRGIKFLVNYIPEFYNFWIAIGLGITSVFIGLIRNKIKDISISL
ncbi:YjbE family putative metal transport protein [Robertmurraya korlensis]|uniref:YjbE family putative metal transport protein n=1 Tax=Robertmurraya korlensis TaxID=519977 RepID=UPI0008244346|nr:YjbE family putative metal transport protein [Robertmurraya korlensis]